MSHALLKDLGPEPLESAFTVEHLKAACAKRSAAIKLVIMDAKVVVGVGNIYASEALFRAGIRPATPANKISKPRLGKLVAAIREVLSASILEGGTTLRDFLNSDGAARLFQATAVRLRPERRAMPRLRNGDPPCGVRPAGDVLVPGLPEVRMNCRDSRAHAVATP